jgi:hypothetical protein
MRPKHPLAAESGVGKHTARESEAPNSVPSGKSAWRTPTPKFGPGTARFRGLIVSKIRIPEPPQTYWHPAVSAMASLEADERWFESVTAEVCGGWAKLDSARRWI